MRLADLAGKVLAVDGNGELYQFLALIRMRDGSPLHDRYGNSTSHLVGLLYRSTRLVAEFGVRLVFVFDGRPPALKKQEIEKRRARRERFTVEFEQARKAGKEQVAFSKSVMTSRLRPSMVEEAKHLLELLGMPWVQAPGEGEAQAAHMVLRGDAWAVGSKDYDSLLFGAPRLTRFVAVGTKEFLPSTGRFRAVPPEIIHLAQFLLLHGITREQLIDVAILVGNDFNRGIKGIGPKKGLSLVKTFGSIENMPAEIRAALEPHYALVREVFLYPDVTDDYSAEPGSFDEKGVYDFLCGEKDFSRERVEMVVRRMKGASKAPMQ
jgi:flap endonuclease-1